MHAHRAPPPPGAGRFNPWLVAIGAAVAGMLFRSALSPWLGPHLPLIGAFPAIMVAAWYGGFGPGLLATLISTVWSVLIPLPVALAREPSTALRVALLLPSALLICLLAAQLHRRRRDALRHAEEVARLARPSQRLQAALELAAITAVDVDRDLRYLSVHKPPVGLSAEAMIGRMAESLYDASTAATLTAARRRILATGEAYRMEVRVDREGRSEWVDWIGGPLRDTNGRIVGVTNLALDVTDRKQAELALQRREEAQRLLVSLHDPAGVGAPSERLQRAVSRVGRHHGASRCAWIEFDATGMFARIQPDHTEGVASIAGDFRLGGAVGPLIDALRDGAPLAVPDIDTHPLAGTLRGAAAGWTAGCRTLLLAPLLVSGRVVAALCIQRTAAGPWRDDEVALARQLAQRIGSDLDNARDQAALRESRDVLALAMRSGRMGAWSRDMVSGRVWWSRELEDLFGLPPGAFDGSRDGFLAYVHPEDRRRVLASVDAALAAGEDYSIEFRFRYATGEWRWMEGRGKALYDSGGRPKVSYGLGIDVTGRKADDDERRRLNAELAASLRRKDEFLATLAHELRNPLAPIVNALEVFRVKTTADPQLVWSRDVIERQVRHMTRLVDDLLDVARLATGKMQLQYRPTLLNDIVRDGLDTIRAAIDAAGHRLHVTTPKTPVMLDADPTRLAQVLANLLSNAVKYTPPGGCISVLAECRGDIVSIAVADDGVGIEAHHVDDIFTMFAQITPTLERSHGGLGIGLALARSLVELHDGTLTVASPGPGRGSTFTVSLPLSRQAAAPAAPPNLIGSSGSRDAATPVTPTAPAPDDTPTQRRILVVDDNRDAAESLAILLQMDGHHTAMAHDGREAVDCARRFRPDVILLDIGLPLMNGYDVARHLRKQSWGRGISIIAVTGWGQEQDRQRALESGMDHHLTKPLDPARLATLLDRLPGT